MIEVDAGARDEHLASTSRSARRRATPIVPARNVAGRALVLVIAIMTFLSCLTLGAVTLGVTNGDFSFGFA